MRPSSYVRRQSPYALRSTAITPLRAAKRTGPAPVVAQLACGGWNYIHDTASQGSLRKWCETIGANGWRLEEFQHFYGNATFDDAATPSHYGGGRKVVIAALRATYEEPMGMSRSEVADLKARSPLSAHGRRGPPDYCSMSGLSVDDLFRDADLSLPTVTQAHADAVVEGLGGRDHWLTPIGSITNPYRGPAPATPYDGKPYMSRNVGDLYDTSPYDPLKPPVDAPAPDADRP